MDCRHSIDEKDAFLLAWVRLWVVLVAWLYFYGELLESIFDLCSLKSSDFGVLKHVVKIERFLIIIVRFHDDCKLCPVNFFDPFTELCKQLIFASNVFSEFLDESYVLEVFEQLFKMENLCSQRIVTLCSAFLKIEVKDNSMHTLICSSSRNGLCNQN